jgi:hypothetical protein
VQPVSVADTAAELYGLSPAEFTAARDERAKLARAAGQRDDAAAIKKLARPTVSAWLVNQLARNAPDQIARLTEVGDALQEAQRALDGDRLRELSVERRQVVNDLLPEARRLARHAGQPASAAVLDEVRGTLEAALADAGARDAVRSGQLTRALAYAGLGEVDLTAALPVIPGQAPGQAPGPRGRGRGRSEAAGSATAEPAASGSPLRPARSRSRAAARAAGAGADDRAPRAAAAATALADTDRTLAGVTEQRQFLRRRIEGLKEELDQATSDDGKLARDVRQAQRDRDAAARAVAGANLRLDRARQSARRR